MLYVHQGKIKKLPQSWEFKNGATTGNFDLLSTAEHIAEGWLPITVWNGRDYDIGSQTRSAPTITQFSDHAEVSYTVTDIDLSDLRDLKRKELKPQGRQRVYNKYGVEARERVFAGADANTDYNADLAIIRQHWQTVIKPAIQNAQTSAEILAINTDEGSPYEWPTL